MNGPIGKSDLRDAFSFTPTTDAIDLPKPCNLANPSPNRKCLNLREWAQQLKVHEAMVPKLRLSVNGKEMGEMRPAARRETGRGPCSGLSSQSCRQLFVHISAVTDGHEADHARLAIDSVDDSKAPDTIFAQPIEFTLERLSTRGVSRNGTNRSFDGPFQVKMERPNNLSDMRRDFRTKLGHAVRCFFAGVNGSPNTSSKESPFLPER